MASGLTHILLTKKLQDEFESGTLKNVLAFCADSFQVGAVAPDLPYASIADKDFFFKNESSLADSFHYDKTNQIPLQSLKNLKSLKGKINEEIHYQMFSFFLGYISHVIGDGIFHPFVLDKVGIYAENKSEHRSLEMQIDVLFFEELTSHSGLDIELNFTNIHDELENFSKLGGAQKIVQLFSDLINDTYKKRYSPRKILGWINGLHRMFGIAEGDFPRFYRNLEVNTFTFKNREDIVPERVVLLRKPKNWDVNFLHINEIDFFKDCIPQFYKQFIPIAQKAFAYVFEDGEELDDPDIPCINLDTGRLTNSDNLDLIPELWK